MVKCVSVMWKVPSSNLELIVFSNKKKYNLRAMYIVTLYLVEQLLSFLLSKTWHNSVNSVPWAVWIVMMRFTLHFLVSHVGSCWVQNVKLVRVDYWVERAETGIHFEENVLHTDNQIRRARCWFPCVDDNSECCWY